VSLARAIPITCALLAAALGAEQAKLDRVEQMPNLPQPYAMRDWKKVARDYDALAFNFGARGQYLPLIWWDDTKHNAPLRGFGLPSYVGSPYQTGDDTHESINCMAAVVGASLVGIDKANQGGHSFAAMCQRYFNRDNGLSLYMNRVVHGTGGSFWYETYPSILFAHLLHLYPNVGEFRQQLRLSADRMLGAIRALAGPDGVPDFNHTAFDYAKMAPADNSRWKEPDAAAGYAWFLYMAHVKTGEAKYLDGADACMRFLEKHPTNPFYEILLPYGAVLAARMNAEIGRSYDVHKLLSWCFDPSAARPDWGVVADKWGGLDASGLSAGLKDGGGYAFAMNTFDAVATLAPLARYDARYARAIGKYILNAANAARLFYANAHDDAHQSSAAWARQFDRSSCIAYEGCRKTGRLSDKAAADFTTLAGRIASGDFRSTHARREVPPAAEVLEETPDGDAARLEHIWTFEVKKALTRYFHAGVRCETSSPDAGFRFSWAMKPEGPFKPMFTAKPRPDNPLYWHGLPADLDGTLYVKAESTHPTPKGQKPARLTVDVLFSLYEFGRSPFAMGDAVGGHGSPIPTDLGLYGSSHVGYLAAVVEKTNVEGILQLDLVKTDWHHAAAYPTFLYYNPHPEAKQVEIAVGPEPRDLYDAVAHGFVVRGARGKATLPLTPDAARILVLVPANATMTREERRAIANGTVVDYCRP